MAKSKQKKKSTTSSGRRPGRPKGSITGVKLKVVDRFIREYPGQDPKAEFHPATQLDIEKVLPDPEDEASKHQFAPPKKDPTFRKMWMRFIDNVCQRENFKIGHLDSLEILCDLYVEYKELQEFIRTHGRSYLSVGRQGEAWKFFPEVDQVVRVRNQIKEYTKLLDLVLKKDHAGESGGEKDNWE